MNKITRILAIVMAIAMVFGLTACGGNTDAPETTNAPETTAPTTEPVDICKTNGHAWVDATCEAPKTCSVCGETEGEALGHAWIDANYQAPKTCETCGATEGEALVSYFDEYGLTEKLADKTAENEMELVCYSDETKTTVAKVTITDYQTIASDETHAALDGYEWKVMTINLRVSDENAQQYGFYPAMYMWDNKYVSGTIDDLSEDEAASEALFGDGLVLACNWNGVEYTDGLLRIGEFMDDWKQDEDENYYRDLILTVSIRVPVGYDGFVFGIDRHDTVTEGGALHEYITDNTLLFCMD